MEQQNQPHSGSKSDDLDLGQVFQVLGRGFQSFFNGLLRTFLYIKKNILIIGILVIIGVAAGYFLNKWAPEKLKTEVIVKPNLDSKDYLYDVINEIKSNIQSKDAEFIKEIGVQASDLEGFEVLIEPLEAASTTKDDLKYLEVLQKFENNEKVGDIVRAQLADKEKFNHRIVFHYEEAASGKEVSMKLIDYINDNPYYLEMVSIARDNAMERLKEHEKLLVQINELITIYTRKLSTEDSNSGVTQISLQAEEQPNISDLIVRKAAVMRDMENKRLEIKQLEMPIKVINFGKTQAVQKSFFGENVVLFPTILVILFLFFDSIRYLNKRSKELH